MTPMLGNEKRDGIECAECERLNRAWVGADRAMALACQALQEAHRAWYVHRATHREVA